MTRDPDDAVVAEAAIDGRADHLVPHNIRHFAEVADRISIVTPGQLLRIM
jgi:predicted nucleic acid-binding protein